MRLHEIQNNRSNGTFSNAIDRMREGYNSPLQDGKVCYFGVGNQLSHNLRNDYKAVRFYKTPRGMYIHAAIISDDESVVFESNVDSNFDRVRNQAITEDWSIHDILDMIKSS